MDAASAAIHILPHQAVEGLRDYDIAPFFRFPGLGQTSKLKSMLAEQNIAIFSCDVCAEDWRNITPETYYRQTLAEIEDRGRGIIIMHDIQHKTAQKLPEILDELKARGYRIVHMVPTSESPRFQLSVKYQGAGAPPPQAAEAASEP